MQATNSVPLFLYELIINTHYEDNCTANKYQVIKVVFYHNPLLKKNAWCAFENTFLLLLLPSKNNGLSQECLHTYSYEKFPKCIKELPLLKKMGIDLNFIANSIKKGILAMNKLFEISLCTQVLHLKDRGRFSANGLSEQVKHYAT